MSSVSLRRRAAALDDPVVLDVSLIVFGIMKMVPGDVAQVIAGTEETAEDVDLIRRSKSSLRGAPAYQQIPTPNGISAAG